RTEIRNKSTFLYNVGPIGSIDDPNWNRPQRYTVTRIQGKKKTVLATGLSCPPVNVGPRSTPNYAALGAQAVHTLPGGIKVYAGQGPCRSASRLGNPLVNEVLIPMAEKDEWNARPPRGDSRYATYVDKPELAGLLPVLYPGVFPKLKGYSKSRADLDAILLTG